MSNLFEQLGLDPDNFIWEDLASCAGMPTEFYFESYEADRVIAKNVDERCFACPVIQSCAAHAIRNKTEGVWGGIYWNSSGKPDKTKNEHKTEEGWQWLRDKLGIPLK